MEELPIDEYGPVRDRQDLTPHQITMKRILPCPSRELSFSIRGGCWRYSPSATFGDRLGSIRESSGARSMTISVSEAWRDGNSSNTFRSTADEDIHRARKRLKGLIIAEYTKRPRIEDSSAEDSDFKMVGQGQGSICDAVATVVSESTSASPSTGKSVVGNASSVCSVVPKAALYSLYGKRKTQIANKQYLTWNNGARTHELKFSAIFVCPISCEVFLAGRYGSSYEENGSIIWYSKKSLAEHAAAARAYDCFILREGDMTTLQQRKQLGRDQPYHERSEEPLPREIPRFVISAVESMKSLMVTQHPQEIRLGGQDVSTNKVPNIFQPTVKRNKASSEHPT